MVGRVTLECEVKPNPSSIYCVLGDADPFLWASLGGLPFMHFLESPDSKAVKFFSFSPCFENFTVLFTFLVFKSVL